MQTLNPQTKIQYEQRVRQTRDVQERNRLCVILGINNGRTIPDLANALYLSESSIHQYTNEYRTTQKLKGDPRGGSQSKLNPEQTQALLQHLTQTTYLHAKAILKHIHQQHHITYTIPGITTWLRRHQFVYKKPVNIPGRLDPEKQRAFVNTYQTLKETLPANETLYFLDITHPAHPSQAVRGWIRKGKKHQKTLGTTAKQTRLHIVGAMALKTMELVIEELPAVNKEEMVGFFRRLEASSTAAKIHVICDNAPYLKNDFVESGLKGSRIQLMFLPPYSPNLNPIERLWKVMRERVFYNRYYPRFGEFAAAVRYFFSREGLRAEEDVFRRRIDDCFHLIEPNPVQF